MGHTHFEQDAPPASAEKHIYTNGSESPAKRQKLDSPPKARGSPYIDSETRAARATHVEQARRALPIWAGRERILSEVQNQEVVIILGETGCGKTTQVPQFLYDGDCPRKDPRIAITQPRRVAATSLAARVAHEIGCKLGGKVGYTVRFDDCSSEYTAIKYLTDGTLLQELLSDRLLQKYDVVIVDEAHERTLRTDMILGFLKGILKERNSSGGKSKPDQPTTPLKVVVMSATLDAERFATFFDNAPILYVKGRQHAIKLCYTERPQSDYLEAALKAIFQTHLKNPPGDILVFLSGEDEIESLATQIKHYMPALPPAKDKIEVHRLYAKLPPHIQAKAFEPSKPGFRNVILATNIAETSVTIPGVKTVIDPGLMKEKTYNSYMSVDALLIRPISKSAADQRKGRAGRTSGGECLRLYSEAAYKALDRTQTPEILRCNLEFALLHLKAAGQEDVWSFHFIDRPEDEALQTAMLQLVALGAIDTKGNLLEEGRTMASFPLTPSASRILLSSFQLGCPAEITSLLAILDHADKLLSVPASARDAVAVAREPFIHRDGDHLTLLRLLVHYEHLIAQTGGVKAAHQWLKDVHIAHRTMENIIEARKQLRERCERQNLDWRVSAGEEDSTSEKVLKSCASGLAMNAALLREDVFHLAKRGRKGAQDMKIHPSSVLAGKKAKAIIFSELTFTSAIYARGCSAIRPEWLVEHTPALYARRTA